MREPAHAEAVAGKILEAAHAPFEIGELRLSVGASAGLALGTDAARGWADLMARADEKLYLAKRSGRGQFQGG
ncbi:Cyclic di-GMP phosphodiesterase Gmr [compost metagenome]